MVMFTRHTTKLALVATSCLIALSAGGAALARTPSQPDATSSTAPLYNRVLQLGDLHGFWAVTCPVAVTTPSRWAMHNGSAAALSDSGFLNGLREPLRSANPGTKGWSIVAQYRSAAGARRETRSELNQARALGGAFSQFTVDEIPGGHGYSLPDGSRLKIAIFFTAGRFQYLLEVTGAGRAETATLQTRLTRAAVTLYDRATAS
jgi:hypothetical protein